METVIEMQIFTPRWGHCDTYTFLLSHKQIEINMGARTATCAWKKKQDPLWKGETLRDILENDQIYPPAVFQNLVEHAWKSWRNGELGNDEVRNELQALIEWLHKTTEKSQKQSFGENTSNTRMLPSFKARNSCWKESYSAEI